MQESVDLEATDHTRSGAWRRVWIGAHAAIGAGIIAVACSSGGDGQSTPSDSAAVETQPTDAPASTTADTEPASTEPASTGPATTEADAIEPDVEVSLVSFANDVQPILEYNCASCHIGDGPGTVHLDMSTVDGVTGFDADYIDAVVSVGYMPPWPAADGDTAFHDDRRLGEADKATLSAWADQGGDIDVEPGTPIVPTNNNRPEMDEDIRLTGEPYKGAVETDIDDYRCQMYDPGYTEPGFVTGFDIDADRTEVVHHALVFVADASARETAIERDLADPAIGWSCTGLAGLPGVSQVHSWAPGQDPNIFPDGAGVPVNEGDFFVMQIHYHYEPELANLPADQSSLLVQMANEDDIAANGGSLDPIALSLYLGPAEIPCSTDEVGPLCDRDAAVAQLAEREGTLASAIADTLMRACGTTVADYADMTDGIASSSCDQPARPGKIISVWGHEHEIGKSFKMTLNPGTPEERVLLDIPNWDFDWQLGYQPIDDIVLDDDDIIRVECTWDRSKIPDDAEPRYVLWAEGTNDEMCYSQIVTRPV